MNIRSVHQYNYHQPRRKSKAPLLFALLALISVVLVAVFLTSYNNSGQQNSADQDKNQPVAAEQPKPVAASSKMLFAGDIFWSRRMNTWAQASPLKEAYPFSGLSGFNRSDYDAWIGNMECPTDPNVQPTAHEEEELLMFNCPATYLPELAKWFNIVSLANNHTDNHGLDSFQATRAELDKNNIQYFGHYDPAVTNEVCEMVSVPTKITLSDGSITTGSLPIAMCGHHGVFKIPLADSLAIIEEYSQYVPVIAMPHMGVEYKPSADTLRTNLYRQMIDKGADAVLGGHPHWVQNSEAYKDKLIVYSLGNFIFDQQSNAEVNRSAVITAQLDTVDISQEQLAAWLQISEHCKEFADGCLEQIKQQRLSKLPASFTFGMTAGDSISQLTKPASPAVAKAVADRLNWDTTAAALKPLGVPFGQ